MRMTIFFYMFLIYWSSCRYARAEVIAGFVNGLFLVFVAFFILSEAVEVSESY